MSIFFVAEIGINHNGDVSVAKKLIDSAADFGFDAVKFQKREISEVYSKNFLSQPRKSPWGNTQLDQKKGLELNFEEYKEIDLYCKKKKIQWFASAWEKQSLKFLDKFNLNFNKIASAMTFDLDFIKEVADRNKHTFISTAMTSEKQIEAIINIFYKKGCSFELMHCVATYPLKPENANLKRILTLRERFKCKVGYSGHEDGVAISLAAVAMGISSLERHITLNRTMYGSDQAASLGMGGSRELISAAKKIEMANQKKGDINEMLEEEEKISDKLRSHLKNYKPYYNK